jgi:DNA-binding LytR/AlgR family response regulator
MRRQERTAFKNTPTEIDTMGDYFVRVDGTYFRLDLEDVLWLEAEGDYVRIRTTDRTHFVLGTLKSWQDKLPTPAFLRVHRSFIVRFDKIESVGQGHIVVAEREIPVGATHRATLLAELREI